MNCEVAIYAPNFGNGRFNFAKSGKSGALLNKG